MQKPGGREAITSWLSESIASSRWTGNDHIILLTQQLADLLVSVNSMQLIKTPRLFMNGRVLFATSLQNSTLRQLPDMCTAWISQRNTTLGTLIRWSYSTPRQWNQNPIPKCALGIICKQLPKEWIIWYYGWIATEKAKTSALKSLRTVCRTWSTHRRETRWRMCWEPSFLVRTSGWERKGETEGIVYQSLTHVYSYYQGRCASSHEQSWCAKWKRSERYGLVW